MLCKWCGAELPDHAAKCKRCGNSVPAISDCGGFYDIVPGAKKLAAKHEPLQDAPKLEVPVKAAAGRGDPGARKNGSQRSFILQIVAIVLCVVLIAVLLLDVKVRLEEGSAGRDRDDEDIGTIIDTGENPDGDDPGSTDPDQGSSGEEKPNEGDPGEEKPNEGDPGEEKPNEGSSEEEKPNDGGSEEEKPDDVDPDKDDPDAKKGPLEEQDLEIEVGVELEDDKIHVSTEVNEGDIAGEVSAGVDRADDPSEFTIEVDLGEHKDGIDIEIKNLVFKDPQRKEALSLEFEAEDAVFGKVDGKAEFTLEFRLGRFDEWKTLDEDMFQIVKGGTVVIEADTLQALLGDEESIELKVTYKRVSRKGGSLTVIVSGLKVDAAAYTEKK